MCTFYHSFIKNQIFQTIKRILIKLYNKYFYIGFNPVWNETLEFNLNAPELALIRFELWDEDLGKDDFIAQTVVPFASVRPGKLTFLKRPYIKQLNKIDFL